MAKTYLTPDEVKIMEKKAANLRDKLLIRLLFHLGCRVSEALALEVRHIDLDNALVMIQHLKTRARFSCPHCNSRLSKNSTYCPSCGARVGKLISRMQEHHRQRILPIDSETLSMLQDYIRRGGPILSERKKLIFGIKRHRAWQIVKECGERARLPKLINPETGKAHNVSPHRLRDAFAVHAVKLDDSGEGLRLLQEHLGHQSFNTTARYRKVAGEEHREWYQKLWHEEKNSDGTTR